ncbi:MAG: isoprenyl transferase [Alphaproteobacteria bacterium]
MTAIQPIADPLPLPCHIGIIMDGNGRWAQARGLPRTVGHRKGIEAVRSVVQAASDLSIPYLTLYGFSLENWSRPLLEINELMGLLRHYLRSELAELHQNGVRIRTIGDLARLPADIQALVRNAEVTTQNNTRLNLTIALSYGGRQEIINAVQCLAQAVAAGHLSPQAIDETIVRGALSTADLPDPDLIIRTSGEKRISNFLLWQSAYAEMVFVDTLWPEFGREDLVAAIREYQQRERRYGSANISQHL